MPSPLVNALKTEISALEAELSKSATWVKLVEARRLLGLYEGDLLATQDLDHARKISVIVTANTKRRSSKASPERRRILEQSAEILRGRSSPTRTAEIFKVLQSLGVEIPGEKPQNNLSAMLSNSPMFNSNGRAGWTLADTESPETPEGDLLTGNSSEASNDRGLAIREPTTTVRPVNPGPGGGT